MMEGSGERKQQTTGTDKKLNCKHDFSSVAQPFYSIFNGRYYERVQRQKLTARQSIISTLFRSELNESGSGKLPWRDYEISQ